MSKLLPLENIRSDFVDIQPLPEALLPVEPFNYHLLPEGALSQHVQDIAERMQCPPDFVAVPLMIALASVIGRSHQIMPKEFDDWTVVPNLWGLIIGKPSLLKTPAAAEAIKHLKRAETAAKEEFDREIQEYKKDVIFEAVSQKAREADVKKFASSEKFVGGNWHR
jgi:hypothetical protein